MEWDIRRETIQHIAGKCLCENIFKKAIYFSLKIFLSGLYIFFAKKVDSDFQTTLKVIQQGFFLIWSLTHCHHHVRYCVK